MTKQEYPLVHKVIKLLKKIIELREEMDTYEKIALENSFPGIESLLIQTENFLDKY